MQEPSTKLLMWCYAYARRRGAIAFFVQLQIVYTPLITKARIPRRRHRRRYPRPNDHGVLLGVKCAQERCAI